MLNRQLKHVQSVATPTFKQPPPSPGSVTHQSGEVHAIPPGVCIKVKLQAGYQLIITVQL